jgi:hypothetical protein
MNLELAQLVALVTHGNAYLISKARAQPPEISHELSVFDNLKRITFVEKKGPSEKTQTQLSEGTAGWYRHLKDHKVRRLRIVTINWSKERPDLPPVMASAFAGCGNWALLSEGTKADVIWFPQYSSGNDECLTFVGTQLDKRFPEASTDLDVAELTLKNALKNIRDYAVEEKVGDNWVGIFSRALDILGSDEPSRAYISELLPETGYGHKTRRILQAASEAWVFGGMGSWNDLCGDERYSAVTDALYGSIIDGIITATNSIGTS